MAQQRKLLTQQRSAIDSELKLARLVAVDAEQRSADLVRQRRAQFRAALTARMTHAGPVLAQSAQCRAARSGAPAGPWARIWPAPSRATLQSPRHNAFWAYLALALLLAVGGPWLAERILLRALPPRLPAARLFAAPCWPAPPS